MTELLRRWRAGDDRAMDELMPLAYGELRRMAGRYLSHERRSHTLETRDLIHETFFRLVGQRHVEWQSRAHFFSIAARTMRRILVDYGRRRRSQKRGGGQLVLTVSEPAAPDAMSGADLLALDEALDDLERVEPTLARIVELRFFGGLDHEEVAVVLGVSGPTVRRRWRLAKAWLYRRLHGGTLSTDDTGSVDSAS